MLNNEIDVSKCRYYMSIDGCCLASYEENEIGGSWEFCKDNPDCYYKQLQQARADVEKAKKYNYDAGQQLIRMSQEVQQLKAENEELQEECERLKKIGSYGILQEVKKNKQIENCLDEIEEICKNSCGMLSPEDCGDFESCQVCKRKSDSETILIILQLIKRTKEGK